MNKTVKINNQEINVNFTNYYDSVLGDFLFQQVMCDVFMPGNEVVPVAIEKQQIKLIMEGFKKRSVLYQEIRKENVKGKSYYVIPPRMRYDVGWLEEKKKVPLTKEGPAKVVEPVSPVTPKQQEPTVGKQKEYTDNRRKLLVSKGFTYNDSTRNWEAGSIRFPDSLIDKAGSDEEFADGMTRLIDADAKSRQKKKKKAVEGN